MSEDSGLMLNLDGENTSYVHPNKNYQKPSKFSKAQKWALKKQGAQKRKASLGFQNHQEPSFKQKRTEQTALQNSEDVPTDPAPPSPVRNPPQKTTAKTPSPEKAPRPLEKTKPKQKKAKQRTAQKPGRTGEQRREEGREDRTDRPHIKTSSLFKNNPEIPDVHRPDVTQPKEKVFTNDSFSELDLHPHLVATLNKVLNVTCLTSVQKQTIPVLMSGRDAVVRSQTGSGKTLAYGIPLVQSLQAVEPKIKRGDGPLAVVIVPTRELAQQSFQIIQKLLKPFTWIVPGVLMGGEKKKSEKARLRKGINILISTPGRLVDHIKNTLSIVFSATCWLILDEADRTLDLGFEKDLTVILNAINSAAPPRQNVLLSATLTEGLARLAGVCMKDPVSIQVSDNAEANIATPVSSADRAVQNKSESFAVPENLQQHMVVVPSKLRLVCLAAFILARCKFEKGHKLIIFVSSCEVVEFLLSIFTSIFCGPNSNLKRPLRLFRLHGNMKQEDRTEVFQEFSGCKTGVLLCTDVAARGLDLPQVTWIIQYNPPTTPAEYVHRVGRTARIGAQGSSVLFLTPAEVKYVSELAKHNISLSEMKLQDILSCLMLDDTYKGRGKYHSKKSAGALEQEVRERATVLQTEFENVVHASEESVQAAKKALQSFLRAYTAYPANLKHIFHIRSLHLGHAAKSFGLRDAPQGLANSTGTAGPSKGSKQGQNKAKDQAKGKGLKKMSTKERVASLMRSEFSSGIEGDSTAKKKKKKKQPIAEGEEE